MKCLSIILTIIATVATYAIAGRVESVRFKTAATPPACRIPASLRENEGNHFFLLSDRKNTFGAIRGFMKK